MNAEAQKPVTAEAPEALTLRDQFAIAALPGILATYCAGKLPKNAFEIAAMAAYLCADAMIEARAIERKDTENGCVKALQALQPRAGADTASIICAIGE